jgi:hypothetical protein
MKTVKKMEMGGTAKAKKQAATAMAMKAAGKKPKMAMGGALKEVPASKVGLAKLPTEVRNKMGYKKYGGTAPKAGMGTMKAKMGGSMKGKKC